MTYGGSLVVVAVLVGGCASSQGNGSPDGAPAGSATSTTATADGAGNPTPARTALGPQSLAECEAKPKPNDSCHWAIIPQSYCGGAPPLPEMTAPICACVACTENAHCGTEAGGRCDTLMTDAECHPGQQVCVYPSDPCYKGHSVCKAGEQCMAENGRAVCHKPTEYMPRP
ncbi:MAG: hypothetical protein HOW73_46530 [Polyangiaceae bacterium]|nr:hypothetical protein [Polyangiaceae bacterium]